MERRTTIASWVALVVVGSLLGLVIAGFPEVSSGPEPPPLEEITVGTGERPANGGAPPTTVAMVPTSEPTPTSTPVPPTSEPPPTSAPVPPTSEPPIELRPNQQVKVLVANATDVVGAAARLTDRFRGDGHPTGQPLSTTGFATSEIWFVDGFGLEGAALAERIGVFPENVQLVPDAPAFAIGDAHLIVVIGSDLAGG